VPLFFVARFSFPSSDGRFSERCQWNFSSDLEGLRKQKNPRQKTTAQSSLFFPRQRSDVVSRIQGRLPIVSRVSLVVGAAGSEKELPDCQR
jgi:hypothetical protein